MDYIMLIIKSNEVIMSLITSSMIKKFEEELTKKLGFDFIKDPGLLWMKMGCTRHQSGASVNDSGHASYLITALTKLYLC